MEADQVAVKIKWALCVQTRSLPVHFPVHVGREVLPIFNRFYNLPALLADRRTCETDETLRQLLPYVVVQDQASRVFLYSRGGSGDEDRLHAKLSIGVGGHVDGMPGELGLAQYLDREAMREIKEEIGVFPLAAPYFSALLVDNTNAVGRVHLGILGACRIEDSNAIVQEEGCIENGRWVTKEELMAPEVFNRLENWSQMAAIHMFSVQHHPV